MRIYIDIEAFFDWRYARACTVSPNIKGDFVERLEDYRKRDHDCLWTMFASINKGQYKKVPFSKGVLAKSQLTRCDDLIKEAYISYIQRPDVKEEDKNATIDVDFMGLTLTKDEEKRFKVAFSARFDHGFKINIISLPRLNPNKLDRRYQLAIIYDLNVRLFPRQTKPSHALVYCNVYTPFRFKEEMLDKANKFAEIHRNMPYKTDQLTVLEEHMFGAAPIHFIEMEYFCLRTPV